MGFFDFFKRDKGLPAEEMPKDRKLASLGKTASDKRAQAYDRDEAIRALAAWGTHEAAAALLKRFRLSVDPSITDQEEKQLAFDGIVAIGKGQLGKRVSDAGKDPKQISDEPLTKEERRELRDAVVAEVETFCQRAENYTWAIKVLRALLNDAGYERQLLSLLAKHDTEYTRNIEPKVNMLGALEDVHSDAVRLAVEEYLDDVDETVRFHAVQTAFEQGDEASIPALVKLVQNEESVRIKNKVADGLSQQEWKVSEELVETFRDGMKDAYEWNVNADGSLSKA